MTNTNSYFFSILKRTRGCTLRNAINTSLNSLYAHIKQDLKEGKMILGSEVYTAPKTAEVKLICSESKVVQLKPVKRPIGRLQVKTNSIAKRVHSWLTTEGRKQQKENWYKKIDSSKLFVKKMQKIQKDIENRKQEKKCSILSYIGIDPRNKSPSEINDLIDKYKARKGCKSKQREETIKRVYQPNTIHLPELSAKKRIRDIENMESKKMTSVSKYKAKKQSNESKANTTLENLSNNFAT